MSRDRQRIPTPEARLILGSPPEELPPADELLGFARTIVSENLRMDEKLASLRETGLLLSPVWEPREGVLEMRLAVLPPVFRERYFVGEAAQTLRLEESLELVCSVLPWMASDPVGAVVVLEDTLRMWLDDTAPVKRFGLRCPPYARLLSLLLADFARKASVGLLADEWLLSIGLPPDPETPPADVEDALAAMREGLEALRRDERTWRARAFQAP